MRTSAGRRDRPLYFEIPLRRPDGSGGSEVEWTQPTLVWAEMIALRNETALAHQLETSRTTWKVTIAWRPDITAQCRAVFEGQALEIIGAPIDPDGRRRELVMTCQSGRAA